MKPFIHDDFLLTSELAKDLYHHYARDLPIIDYHCHLNPEEIYMDKRYQNLTEVWLYGDHYKWRAMRAIGVDEYYITGEATDYDKFLAWAKTVPQLIGNPLYHWTHLELKRYFQIDELLDEQSAPRIWEQANHLLTSGKLTVRSLINQSNVSVICTTDDPIDSLDFHEKIAADKSFDVLVLPSFRPDKALAIDADYFLDWKNQLAGISGVAVHNYQTFLDALITRISFFNDKGCRVSDHALDQFNYSHTSFEEAEAVFAKALKQEQIGKEERDKFKSYTLTELARQYHNYGWAMQLHFNASRNLNSVMFDELGPDTGYDGISDHLLASSLAQFLDELAKEKQLAKTIVYSLNPNDLPIIATIIGSFQGDGIPGKMQLGTSWWFNDTKKGMLKQMETLADIGVFGQFIGMLTDSRSFLSYPRHEYFRRILCQLIANWVEQGEYPNHAPYLQNIIEAISYQNAKRYFDFQ
ncbi:D-glucuronate isomerase [Amphibacillus marinus]|uniref:Uronate isomerase n=1 Tax=Amphibacillus marinus TaxID=872970 RepID=A0A1H8HA03_9BACI|nr:glucuronate isomerase [Amphibacillus marinus]SEN52975.1 D-glucuronate isomerase [Amphibacillus marinus]